MLQGAFSQLQRPWFNPKLGLLEFLCISFFQVLQFSLTSQKHASKWAGYAKIAPTVGLTEDPDQDKVLPETE